MATTVEEINAIETVFGIGELVCFVAGHLTLKSLGMITRTNQFIKNSIEINMPIYKQIQICYSVDRPKHLTLIQYLFLRACEYGAIHLIRYLYQNHHDHVLKFLDKGFIEASRCGHIFVVQFMIESGANINAGQRAIFYAAKNGHLHVVKYLTTQKINYDIMFHVLRPACVGGQFNVLLYAIENGAVVSEHEYETACKYGHLDIVKFFYEQNLTKIFDHSLVFQTICTRGHLSLAKFFLERYDFLERNLGLILRYVCFYGYLQMIQYLVQYTTPNEIHADIHCGFILAIEQGYLNIVKFLVRVHVDVFSKPQYLVKACDHGHLDIIKFLTRKTNSIFYPKILKRVCKKNQLKVVQCLLETGVDVHLDNDLALRTACKRGYIKLVKILIEKGANIHAKNDRPFQLACRSGKIEMVKYLVEMGANIDIKNSNALLEAKKEAKKRLKNLFRIPELIKYRHNDIHNLEQVINYLVELGFKDTWFPCILF